MSSPRRVILLLVAFSFLATSDAGPLGPLPNVTSADLGLKEGSCAVGDVVYMPGDEFPGSGPCERCSCAGGDVQCARTRCEPRPGCKALHRPDQCCPTYQCECEQEGRVYGNGEKLVDPADPCRVCYCQGGEVVCRRIACFLRDDCKPRLVPGRCCPEYDNCPLRGVTAVPGVPPTISSISSIEDMGPSAAPPVPKENIKQEITIKEITPVSEIPIITDVKIKEILPSPSIEVAEYSSSKSPLIPREATSEKSASSQSESTERPVIIEIHPSSAPAFISSDFPEIIASSSEISETKSANNNMTPSKFSLSTQDSINSDIYPSNEPVLGTAGSPSIKEVIPLATTAKPAIVLEEDDPTLFEHNPEFPPLPDDFSVLTNHGEDIVPDTNSDDHGSHTQEVATSTITEAPVVSETQTIKVNSDVSTSTSITSDTSTTTVLSTTKTEGLNSELTSTKQSPMLNLRSAIPTEILNVPSSVPEDITGELDDITESTTTSVETSPVATTIESAVKKEETTPEQTTSVTSTIKPSSMSYIPGLKVLGVTSAEPVSVTNTKEINEQSTTSVARSNDPTEITAQTEFSSLPIETSDQNPHDVTGKEKLATSSIEPTVVEVAPTKLSPLEPEVITLSRDVPTITENHSYENVETTEFILTSFGSSESATDAVELIKISPESGKSAAIIEPATPKKNSVLTDLINLIDDVATISNHTDEPVRSATNAPSISESEELIPVNAGYKSKNSNWNVNSITEIVPKSKNPVPVNKQKVIEIEDDEDGITDSPPPNDKIEPTTRRPIIDNVSDDMPENKTDKKDIEFINKVYVPNPERRPTKVVMKKNNDKPIAEENASASVSSETSTDDKISVSSESTTPVVSNTSAEAGQRIEAGEASTITPSPTPQ